MSSCQAHTDRHPQRALWVGAAAVGCGNMNGAPPWWNAHCVVPMVYREQGREDSGSIHSQILQACSESQGAEHLEEAFSLQQVLNPRLRSDHYLSLCQEWELSCGSCDRASSVSAEALCPVQCRGRQKSCGKEGPMVHHFQGSPAAAESRGRLWVLL